MSNRHQKIGFKQIVRLEWMDRTLSLVLAGLSEKEIRSNLEEYLSTQRQSGGEGPIRNKATFGMSIILLSCWFRDEPELDDFRKALVAKARTMHQKDWLPLHWAMLGAGYPFFTVVCEQIGRLFALQEEITSGQVYSRMRQAFGDKEMIRRNARYVVSSLVSWGLLEILQLVNMGAMSSQNALSSMIPKRLHCFLKVSFFQYPKSVVSGMPWCATEHCMDLTSSSLQSRID